ncbi:hypothetical protein EDD37DRAFT_65771 [Exophiala viscosa]|uniref:Uncharacterized protein n=1 Tax=Exophiala viscosa TaxID=2486360 RepID=A0AAN6E3N1_9EURO|nr:hypothetical protein EDD36DRAFT_144179 [Exophiala viscosa]KAI1629706.1 hypothetical protein EDD37DRAFT_65771 [Exophiala viscosa]
MFPRRALSTRCLRHASIDSAPAGGIPSLRPRIPRTPVFRSFHSSRPNRLVAEALQLSQEAFQGVHSLTGLPWYLSIPLTATLFRLLSLPILYFTNKSVQREQKIAPILKGWREAYKWRARLQFPAGGTEETAKKAEAWVQSQLSVRHKLLQKSYKIMGSWSRGALQISFLPIYIVNADVIRRMAGDERTLLSLFTKTNGKVDTSIVPPEPGLQTEAFSWIPTLTSPDELWILPLAFGALSVTSTWLAVGKYIKTQQRTITGMPLGPMRTRQVVYLQISQFVMAASFLFPALIIIWELPTAVTLYFIGSVGTQLVQRPLVRWLVGNKKPIEPLEARLPKLKGEKET